MYLCETNKKQTNISQSVSQFGLCLDEKQILRCLINGESHMQKLIIAENHNAVLLHNGIAQTVCHVREKYWILLARQLVKEFIHQCYVCRKHHGKTYEAPPVPSLPDFIVPGSPPFYNTRLDFIQPLLNTKGFKMSKNYILLLTCCTTRAVTLEVCDNLYISFRRFAATRALSRLLVSDNALTVKMASKEASKIVRLTEVKRGGKLHQGGFLMQNCPHPSYFGTGEFSLSSHLSSFLVCLNPLNISLHHISGA